MRHYTAQDNGLVQHWGGLSQSLVRARCRAVVLEVIPRAVLGQDHGGDCIVEIGDGDRSVEDADGDIAMGIDDD